MTTNQPAPPAHSPTPWHTPQQATGKNLPVCASHGMVLFYACSEDAAFIVEAVNSHAALLAQRDALLKAAKEAAQWFENHGYDTIETTVESQLLSDLIAVARKIDAETLRPFVGPDPGFCAGDMAKLFSIPAPLAAEIMYENDEASWSKIAPAKRFELMRKWCVQQIEQAEAYRAAAYERRETKRVERDLKMGVQP